MKTTPLVITFILCTLAVIVYLEAVRQSERREKIESRQAELKYHNQLLLIGTLKESIDQQIRYDKKVDPQLRAEYDQARQAAWETARKWMFYPPD
jgi:predicted Holliday junction resolvase-like endonuclease